MAPSFILKYMLIFKFNRYILSDFIFSKSGLPYLIVKQVKLLKFSWFRSSRPEVFCKKGVHINSAKFTGKHLRQSFFFNKVTNLRPATLLNNRLWHRCFPVNFGKLLRTPFFKEHLWWLLLLILNWVY